MKHLKTLTLSFTLMCLLAVAAFAGETNTPPCAPGETHSPPCSTESVTDDSTDPGETNSPPAAGPVDMVDIVEAALWSLMLF